MIIYQLDSHYNQAKVLGIQVITSMTDMTLASLCVVEKFASKKPIAYAAIADGQTFEVYAGLIFDHQIKSLTSILTVSDAQADTISRI